MTHDEDDAVTERFYLEGHDYQGAEVAARPAEYGDPPISPHGPPEPGTGRVFVTYDGDSSHAWGHWECEERFVFYTGEYGDVLLWALSQPARQYYVPHPVADGTVEVFPHKSGQD